MCSLVAAKATAVLKNGKKVLENPLDEELIHKYMSDMKDEYVLLKLMNEVFKLTSDENQNLKPGCEEESLKEMVADLQKKPEFDLSLDLINQVSKNEHLIRSLLDIVSENFVPKKEIKVLEINLTNGLFAEEVDNHLATAHIYPIDVNYSIAVKSVETLNESFRQKSFKISEWDLKKSVFPSDASMPHLLIVNDTTDLWELPLDEFAQEMYDTVMTKGFLLSVFRYKFTEPEITLNAINGKNHLSNADLDRRVKEFAAAAQKVGFSVIGNKSDSIGSMALLFKKVEGKEPEVPNKKFVINIEDNHRQQWFQTIKDILLDKKENEKNTDNIWLIAKDSDLNGVVGLVNCLRLEPGGDSIRCIYDVDKQFKGDFKDSPYYDILTNDLAINVLKDGKLGTYRHLTLPKDYDKVQSEDYFLNIGQNRDLSSLQWYDSKNLFKKDVFYDLSNKKVKQVRCNIYSSGLNFRDVMLATGMCFCLTSIRNLKFFDII